MHALPQHEKETIKHFAKNLNNLNIQDHHYQSVTQSIAWKNLAAGNSIKCSCY